MNTISRLNARNMYQLIGQFAVTLDPLCTNHTFWFTTPAQAATRPS